MANCLTILVLFLTAFLVFSPSHHMRLAHWPQPLDLLWLAALVMGAFVAGRFARPRAAFLIYGGIGILATALNFVGNSRLGLRMRSPVLHELVIWIIAAVSVMVLCHAAGYLGDLSARGRVLPVTLCRKCRYDLRGNESGRCPECGQEIPVEQREHLRLPEEVAHR